MSQDKSPHALFPTPTPGFEFPPEARDLIDKRLRQSVGQDPRQIRSVRPERQPQPIVPDFVPPRAQTQAESVARSGTILEQHRHVGSTSVLATGPVDPQDVGPGPTQGPGPNMVPNPQPPMTPMDTTDMTTVDLPSRFAYYTFKDLYVKPLRVPHLAKMSKAADASSMQLIAEVVSSVLATPNGEKNIGFKLSVNDLNAVLYWLRANSFKKNTMKVGHTCSNPHHHEKVMEGLLSRQSLDNESVHDVSKLEVVYLDPKPDPEYFHVVVDLGGKQYRIDLRPETVLDSIEFLDDPRFVDESWQYLARAASMLDLDSAFPRLDKETGVHKRWTLLEKIQVVEDHLTTDDTLLVLEFSELVDRFGINEFVQVKCKECGHEEQIKLVVDARTFSSPRF